MAAPANSIYIIKLWQHGNNMEKKIMSILQLREQAKACNTDGKSKMVYWVDWGSKAVPNCIKCESTVQGFVDRCNGQIQMCKGTME